MLYVTLTTPEMDDLVRDLREFEVRVHDVAPLAALIADDLHVQNMEARMMGVDRDNQPFAELRPATWDRHPDRGPGPPLAGMEMSSRIVGGFEVETTVDGVGTAEVVGHWPSMDEFIIYHITGTIHMAQRDPAGVTPRGWAAVADSFDRWMSSVAGVGE